MSNQQEPRDLLDELETLQRVLDDAASDQVDQKISIPSLDSTDDIPVLDDMLATKMTPVPDPEPPLLKPEAPVLKAVPVDPGLSQIIAPHAAADEPTTFDPLDIADLIGQNLDSHTDETTPFTDLDFDQHSAEPAPNKIPTASQTTPQQTEQESVKREGSVAEASVEAPIGANNSMPAGISNNPFLPQSVLDRLAHERKAAQFSAEQAQQSIAKITTPQVTSSKVSGIEESNTHETETAAITEQQKANIIDQLVQDMLPEIEDRLRKALHDKL